MSTCTSATINKIRNISLTPKSYFEFLYSKSYFPSPSPCQPWIWFWPKSYALSGILCIWNHILWSLQCLTFFTKPSYLRSIHVVASTDSLFLFMTEDYSTAWMDLTDGSFPN